MQDWHPVFENVETRLAGWRAHLLSRGGCLVLLKAVLEAILTYFMTIFRMPVRVHRWLEQLMRGFFCLGTRPEESRGVALVAWETVCRPVDQGGLGIWQLLHTNTTLLSKWVYRLLQPTGDLVTTVLRDEYGTMLDWQLWQTPRRGDSAFISSLRAVFQAIRPFFRPRLGSGESFCLRQLFPRLFALSLDQEGPSIGPGTTHGPPPYPKHYPTSGQGIFSGYRSYLRIGNHQTGQMRGYGVSLFSPFALSISAFGTKWGQRILLFGEDGDGYGRSESSPGSCSASTS